jgi:hypothetical protein
MPPWGRPLGRRERERWERYQQALFDEQRVHEISSDEERHGVPLRVGSKNSRSVSDELYFNDGASRYPTTNSDEHLAYGEAYDSSYDEEEDEEVESPGVAVQVVRRDQEVLLAQRALDRIERAKAKGKPAVNLTHEEIEALERRYSRESPERKERTRKRTSPKDKRSPSLGNGAWTRRKSSRRPSLLVSATATQPKQRAIKSGKKEIDEGPMPPGFMIPGPGGAPVYSPLGYYNAQPSAKRTASNENPSPPTSRGSSRSASNSSRHTQAYDSPPYPVGRHYNGADPRPASSSTRKSSLPSDPDYFQQPYTPYQTYPPPGRRVASGPPEVSYSNVYRRVPPSTSARGRITPSNSDPSLHYMERGPSGLGNEYEASSSTSDDDSEDDLAPVTEPVQESKSTGHSTRRRRR